MNLEKLYKDLETIKNNRNLEKLDSILLDLKTEIINGGKPKASVINAFKRIQKDNNHLRFKKIYKSTEGNFTYCNGYLLIKFGKSIENVPTALRAYVNLEDTTNNIDYDTLTSGLNANNTCEIDLNKLQKVINYNKINKDNKIYFNIGKNINIFIQADKFKDMLDTLNYKEDTITINHTDNKRNPIIFNVNNYECLMLPMDFAKEIEENINSKLEELGV